MRGRHLVSIFAVASVFAALAAPPTAASRRAESDDRVPGSYIVALRRGVRPSEAAGIARDHGGKAVHVFDRLGGFAFSGPDDARARLADDPRVRLVEADRLVRATSAPPFGSMSHLGRTDAYDAETAGYDGQGVSIAIIDTGVYRKHKAFHSGQVVGGKACVRGGTRDLNGHGTRSAGNAAGRAGVAHDATIVPIKVFKGRKLSTTISKVICGLNWVKNRNDSVPGTIDVVNMSLAFGGGSEALRNAVDAVHDSGAVVVAAAGNNNGGATMAPAKYANAIAVTALGAGTTMAGFSARGGEMTAPGVKITSPNAGRGWSKHSGTSRAAPMVAGVAAIVLGEDPTLTPAQVYDVLRTSGRCPNGATNGGAGFCGGSWTGDDGNAEPLADAYCAGILADPAATDPGVCGF